MKRLIALALCLVLSFNILCLSVSAEESYKFSDEQLALLTAIGMYDKDVQLSEKITRAEFADMLVKSIFEEPEYLIEGTEAFADVSADNEYYAPIMLLKNLMVTLGDGEGNFNPDEEIFVNDAIVMAVRFLGYTKLAERTGYIPFAAQKGISKNMHYTYDETLSRYNALLLVFNVLNTDVSDRFIDETIASTYMRAYRNLFIVEGIVTDDGFINGHGLSEIGANEIAVDGKVYKNATNERNLYGCSVKGYYRETIDEEATIIALVKTKDNNLLSINGKNIEKFDNAERVYEYRENEYEDDTETAYVPSDITIVYNGVTLGIDDGEITAEDMVPKSGNITLFDSDNDKKYDILYINEYETYVVSATDTTNNIIYMKEYKEPLKLKKDKFEVFDKDGQIVSFEDIKANSTISVLKALAGDVIRIYVSSYTISDVVVAKDEDATITTKSNGNYALSYSFIKQAYEEVVPEDKRKDTDNKIAYALDKLEFTTFYKIYIDVFGDIAYIEPEILNIWVTAVLVSAGNEARGTIADDFKIQFYSTDGKMEKYNLAEKVNIAYSDNTEKRLEDKVAINEIKNYIDANVANGNRLVRYKINMKALITDIEFPLAIGTEIADINTDRMYIIQDTSSKLKYEGNIFQGKVVPSATCKVIGVPLTNITNEEDYLVSTTTNAFTNNGTYSLIAYGTDTKMMTADYFLAVGGKTVNTSAERAFIVSKIIEYYDHDKNEKGYELEGFLNATAQTYYIDDASVLTSATALDGSVLRIEPGDVIAYSAYTGQGGRAIINKAYVLYDANGKIKNTDKGFFGLKDGAVAGASTDVLAEGSAYGNPVSFTTSAGNLLLNSALTSHKDPFSNRIASGYIYSYKDGNIMFTTQPLGTGLKYTSADTTGKFVTEIYSNVINKTLYVKKYKSGKTEIRKATEADIKPYTVYGKACSKVVWFGSWGLDAIYIIDEV